MGDALLVHVHIPRSAGTSIAQWLLAAAERGLISGHARIYTGYDFRSDDQLATIKANDRRLTTISTHNIRTYPAQWCERPSYYFSVLREPLSHFASIVRYMLEHREAFGVPATRTDQRAVAEWLLERSPGELGRENSQVNHLALGTWCQSVGGLDPDDAAHWSADVRATYEHDRLRVARNILQSFLAVGVFERLFESLFVLRHRAARVGIQLLPARSVPFVNTTERGADDAAWLAPDDPLGRRIRASLEEDFALHAFANRLLDGQLADAMTSPITPSSAPGTALAG